MRNLATVVEALKAVLPEEAERLEDFRTSALYAAPEMQGFWWHTVADWLERNVPADHPKMKEVYLVFVGSPHPDA